MVRWWIGGLAVALVAGCGGDGAAPDASVDVDAVIEPPVDFSLIVVAEPFPDPELDYLLEVRINGEVIGSNGVNVRARVERMYGSYTDAQMDRFTIDVYLGATLLTEQVQAPGECADAFPEAAQPVETESISLCVHDNGELRRFATTCSSAHGGGVADYFCPPVCRPFADECGGQKCGLEVKNADPYYAHIACVPQGNREINEPCAIDADGHDDCVAGSGCIEGLCRAWCRPFDGCADGEQCIAVPHAPDDLGVCI